MLSAIRSAVLAFLKFLGILGCLVLAWALFMGDFMAVVCGIGSLSGRVAGWLSWSQMVGLLLAVLLVGAGRARGDGPVDFAREVAPIFERHCLRCHRPGHAKGQVSLATVADLKTFEHVVPGEPEASGLLDLLTLPGPSQRPAMPKQGAPLSTEQVAVIRRWIAEGATWPESVVLTDKGRPDASWWSLRPLAEVDVAGPELDLDTTGLPAGWGANPIDRFILKGLREKGLRPSPPADRRALARRVTFDLTGLPPTPQEVAAFVADGSPGAYEALVDRLLASPHYGEQWGRHWLDVARFGESVGFERNVIINNAWPYRDYVIRCFNEDRPFDRFVLEQLAGDVLGRDDPGVEVATGFLVCGPYDNVNNKDAAQTALIRANTIDEMIRGTSEAFLGLTIGCARCHDHKFDPILQHDYYRFYATLAGVQHGSRVVAAPAERAAHKKQVAGLEAEKGRLVDERTRLETEIVTRAEENARAYEERWTRPEVDPTGTEEAFEPVEARFVRLTVSGRKDNPGLSTGYGIDEFEVWTTAEPSRNVALASSGGRADGASRVAEDFADAYSPKRTIDGQLGAVWVAAGPELTITLAKAERIGRVLFSNNRNADSNATNVRIPFVGEYRIAVSTDGREWTEVASSHDRRPSTPAWRRKRFLELATSAEEWARREALATALARVDRRLAELAPLPSWWIGTFRPAEGPFAIMLGGDPQRPGDRVELASLSCLDGVAPVYRLPVETPEAERRLALARWLVAAENPLTSRVLANRLWHYHFGTGIVDTPSDFGAMGSRPTHPELLDWLARRIQTEGWRLKPLQRLIVTSQAYRQSTDFLADAARVDGESRLLWRFPPRRLSAEEVRDTMLDLAGRLDRRMGGPGFRLYRYLEDNVATYVPLDQHGPETYRRAVYHQNARASRVDVLTDFDCPDGAFAAPRRAATTTPLQALTLMNHRFTLDMAGALAERLEREVGPGDPEAAVDRAFVLAYARSPEPDEVRMSADLVRRRGLRSFCRALLNSNELISLN